MIKAGLKELRLCASRFRSSAAQCWSVYDSPNCSKTISVSYSKILLDANFFKFFHSIQFSSSLNMMICLPNLILHSLSQSAILGISNAPVGALIIFIACSHFIFCIVVIMIKVFASPSMLPRRINFITHLYF